MSDAHKSPSASAAPGATTNKPAGGPVTWRSLAVATGVAAGIGTVYYYYKQERLERLKARARNELPAGGVGRPAIGGPFTLMDSRTERTVTDRDFAGRHMLVYFGFTHCPDVCPDEMDKITEVLHLLDKRLGRERVSQLLVPIFISVDPERDTPQAVERFLRDNEFDDRFVGLTGSMEQCVAAARAYRVYFTKTAEDTEDYQVDHSIITYLMGPDGQLVSFFGKNVDAEAEANKIEQALRSAS